MKKLITTAVAAMMILAACDSKKEIGIGSTLEELLKQYSEYKIEVYYTEMGSYEYNSVEEMLNGYGEDWSSPFNDLAIFSPLTPEGYELGTRYFLLLKDLDNKDKYKKESTVWLIDVMGDEEFSAAPSPPDILVGTWKAQVKRGHVAYLEIYVDGVAGLYLGSDEYDELYEIYSGTLYPTDDVDIEGTGVDYLMDMNFVLNWYIYESEDGSPITGVPDSYNGIYSLRHEWEGGKQVLYLKAIEDADPLFGKKEMKMDWTPKTYGGGGSMSDIEGAG